MILFAIHSFVGTGMKITKLWHVLFALITTAMPIVNTFISLLLIIGLILYYEKKD